MYVFNRNAKWLLLTYDYKFWTFYKFDGRFMNFLLIAVIFLYIGFVDYVKFIKSIEYFTNFENYDNQVF